MLATPDVMDLEEAQTGAPAHVTNATKNGCTATKVKLEDSYRSRSVTSD